MHKKEDTLYKRAFNIVPTNYLQFPAMHLIFHNKYPIVWSIAKTWNYVNIRNAKNEKTR